MFTPGKPRAALQVLTEQGHKQTDRQTDRQTEEATRKQRVVDTDPPQPALGWEAGTGRPGRGSQNSEWEGLPQPALGREAGTGRLGTASGILSGKGCR